MWDHTEEQNHHNRAIMLQALLVDEGWKDALNGEFDKHYFRRLEAFLDTEWRQHQVFPSQEHIFRCTSSPGCALAGAGVAQ